MDTVNQTPTTIRYKTTPRGLDIHIDVWAPKEPQTTGDNDLLEPRICPAFLYFHGGAMAFGNRFCFTPSWLHERITALGYLFISADYRLLPSSTGHEVVEDIKDVWTYITDQEATFTLPTERPGDPNRSTRQHKIDTNAIAAGGTSSGGFCAYLAAMHCTSPKPKAILSMYGMGGDIFTTYYLSPKSDKFEPMGKLYDPNDYPHLLHPFNNQSPFAEEVADSPLTFDPDGTPTNPRFTAAWLHLQLAQWLDYYAGEHEPSLSKTLQEICGFEKPVSTMAPTLTLQGDSADEKAKLERAVEAIPERHHILFPQLNVSKDWPPVIMVHGTVDTYVSHVESENLHRLLTNAGVPVKFLLVDGVGHNFDFAFDARSKWKKEIDEVVSFIQEHTSP